MRADNPISKKSPVNAPIFCGVPSAMEMRLSETWKPLLNTFSIFEAHRNVRRFGTRRNIGAAIGRTYEYKITRQNKF